MRRLLALSFVLFSAGAALAQTTTPAPAAAQFVGRNVAMVEIASEGRFLDDPVVRDLVETPVGQPLSMAAVRESIAHLFTLGRYQDVEVEAFDAADGVHLRYNLVPIHAVQALEFQGTLGVRESVVRTAVTDRFGAAPAEGRAAEVARTLQDDFYPRWGYLNASVRSVRRVEHEPERTILAFQIDAGPLARIRNVEISGDPLESRAAFLKRIHAGPGDPYHSDQIDKALADYVESLKKKRRYEANGSQTSVPGGDPSTVDVRVRIEPGPLVSLRFEGDKLPSKKVEELVPLKTEGTITEDFLEDSVARITEYLRQQGHSAAEVSYGREPGVGTLAIVFTVKAGPQYHVATGGLEISGATDVSLEAARPLLDRLLPGALFIDSYLDAVVNAVRALYLQAGYPQVKVTSSISDVAVPRPGEAVVKPTVTIVAGPRASFGTIDFSGNEKLQAEDIRAKLTAESGSAYQDATLRADRDAILAYYLDNGFQSVTVEAKPVASSDGTRVDVHFQINEGAQTIIDHVLIVGNVKTKQSVIERQLRFARNTPLSPENLFESQRNLSQLGLFRRVRISTIPHGADATRADILVTVEEASATTFGYGGGAEASRLLRTAADGTAEERYEFAPRGFFEVTRRNVGGKNRSVNLYTRLALRPDKEATGSSQFGFPEYRVAGTFRETNAFGRKDTDAIIVGSIEQGVRTSFNFWRKGAGAELTSRRGGIRTSVRYSFGVTRTFDIDPTLLEDPNANIGNIDRLFPQVRLSVFSGAVAKDTRDDLIDPHRGWFVSAESSVAARAIGGEVGFLKSYFQGTFVRSLTKTKPIVFAVRGAIGLADGFPRTVLEDGINKTIEDLPASERYFAGGDNTIRGFALDTVGAPNTFSSNGFPTGGNAVLLLNAELRVPLFSSFGIATFVDGGNVFERVTQFDFGKLLGSTGLGLRDKVPIGSSGPMLRLDVGFKMSRRELGGKLESPRAIHFSIGQAF